MYLYNVKELVELVNRDGHDSGEPFDNDSEHDAESESFAVSDSESGCES